MNSLSFILTLERPYSEHVTDMSAEHIQWTNNTQTLVVNLHESTFTAYSTMAAMNTLYAYGSHHFQLRLDKFFKQSP